MLGACALLVSPKRLSKMAVILKPSTLLCFHHALVKRKYRLLYGPRKQPVPRTQRSVKGTHWRGYRDEAAKPSLRLPQDCRANIRKHSQSGSIKISSDAYSSSTTDRCRAVMVLRGSPSSGTSKDSLWSVDFFRCESILLKSYWVMVVMDVFTRRICPALASQWRISTVPSSAECSIARSRSRHRRGASLQTTIHCFAFIGGLRTFAYLKLMRSKPFPVRLVPMLSSSD